MGIFNGIKRFFGGGEEDSDRTPELNQNAITISNFSPNDSSLYVSSQLAREANERGWVIDNELVKQSGVIAKNATQNSKNIKVFGKNLKDLSKAELKTAKEMQKIIGLVSNGDTQKYNILTQTQSLLNAQAAAHQTIRANYKERVRQVDENLRASLNNLQSKREQLKGR